MIPPGELEFYARLFQGLSIEDMAQLYELAETRVLKAGEIYIREGTVNTRLALIREGLIRVFQPGENDEDITFMLRWEQQFIASVDGIHHQRPSRFVYQAVEETTLLEVDYATSQQVIDNNPRLSAARNFLIMEVLAEAMERIESFVLLSPEERYQKLIKEKPGIFNRVPNKHISTLLGITPVSLSRIRKRIAGHK